MAVHRALGPGLVLGCYHNASFFELQSMGLRVSYNVPFAGYLLTVNRKRIKQHALAHAELDIICTDLFKVRIGWRICRRYFLFCIDDETNSIQSKIHKTIGLRFFHD